MQAPVYCGLGSLLVGLAYRYIDGSLEKITLGTVLLWFLTGVLMGSMFKYLEESDLPVLRWTVATVVLTVGIVVLLNAVYRVFVLLGIPLG